MSFRIANHKSPAPLLHMQLSFADGLFWTSVAVCVIAQLLIVRSVLGARHVPEPSAALPRSQSWLEVVWAVVPAVALAFLLAFTWRAMHDAAAGRPDPRPATQAAR